MLTLEHPLGMYLPRLLAFGPGVVDRVATDGLGGPAGTRLLLVSDPAVATSAIEGMLKSKGLPTIRFNAPSREPHMADVRTAAAFAREQRIQAVAGIGGGSA